MVDTLSPLVRRVLARNPSHFTYTGTGTYIIGRGTVAIIDPGPADAAHIRAVLDAVSGETVSDILITHTHLDHSPAARDVAAATGARISGCAPLMLDDDGPRADAGFDPTYQPDQLLGDGGGISGPGWNIAAVDTPGHTSNHLCFALEEEATLFTGDHVMGWSTTVVSPPDGDMGTYMESLQKLLPRTDQIYLPTHGPQVSEPQRLVRGLIAHRRQREAQILRQLQANGPTTIPDLVATMYAKVDRILWPAAGRSVLAHLFHLELRQIVQRVEAEQWALA